MKGITHCCIVRLSGKPPQSLVVRDESRAGGCRVNDLSTRREGKIRLESIEHHDLHFSFSKRFGGCKMANK